MTSRPQKLIDRFGWLKCCYCGGVASTPAKLVAHIVREHGQAGYQCPHCYFRAASQVGHSAIKTLNNYLLALHLANVLEGFFYWDTNVCLPPFELGSWELD